MYLGSIPACAGEPRWKCSWTGTNTVYPRVCGGTKALETAGRKVSGLSPRVRGNRSPWGRLTVYPRVCGGTAPAMVVGALTLGLSPRVRGNRCPPVSSTNSPGSIPACAGEPVVWVRLCPFSPVYPRVCGGTWPTAAPRASSWGLSPRVRGNRGRHCRSFSSIGSIPACAGEPWPRQLAPFLPPVYPRVCGGTWVRSMG